MSLDTYFTWWKGSNERDGRTESRGREGVSCSMGQG